MSIHDNKIRVAILGAGRVVQNRVQEVFANELEGCAVTYVCDKVPAKAEMVARHLKARFLIDHNDMLRADDVDLVYVASESGNHYQHVKQMLEAQKHVIVEKPPALFPEQIRECETLAREKGLMYAVVFQNRLNPAMQILKKTYEQGRFGKIVLATVRLRWCRFQEYYEDGWHGKWVMDGGVINQQAIHHLDALQWICGSVEEVFAYQNNALNQLEAEDTTVAAVRFANGALGVIEATTAARPIDFEASISIVGEKGYVLIDGIALNRISRWQFVEERKEDKDVPTLYSQEVPTGYGLSHGPYIQMVVDRIKEKRIDPPVSTSDCIATVELVHALYRSAELQGPVRLKDRPLSERLGKGLRKV